MRKIAAPMPAAAAVSAASRPAMSQGDATDRPKAVPIASSTNDSAAAEKAPAKMAPHDTVGILDLIETSSITKSARAVGSWIAIGVSKVCWGLQREQAGAHVIAHASTIGAMSFDTASHDHPNLGVPPANVCGLSLFPFRRQGDPPHVAVEPGWRVTVERHMNRTALAFGIGASLILAAGTANAAGSCGAEVAELQQKLGMEQGANATIGATDPGVQQPSPTASADTSSTTTTSPSSDQVANTDNSANATIGATDPGVQQPAPEANATTGASTATTTDGSSTTTADNSGANATIRPTDPGVP